MKWKYAMYTLSQVDMNHHEKTKYVIIWWSSRHLNDPWSRFIIKKKITDCDHWHQTHEKKKINTKDDKLKNSLSKDHCILSSCANILSWIIHHSNCHEQDLYNSISIHLREVVLFMTTDISWNTVKKTLQHRYSTSYDHDEKRIKLFNLCLLQVMQTMQNKLKYIFSVSYIVLLGFRVVNRKITTHVDRKNLSISTYKLISCRLTIPIFWFKQSSFHSGSVPKPLSTIDRFLSLKIRKNA